MKYDLIFYIAKKTGYCEKRLRPIMREIDADPNRIVSATAPTALGEEVKHSLRLTPLVVIIGGLGSLEDDNLAVVLSRAFSNSSLSLEHMRKITSPTGERGYIIRYRSQIILALPDIPDEIEHMLTPDLLRYIAEKTAASA